MKDFKFRFPVEDKIFVSIAIALVVWLIYDNMHSPQKDPIQLTIIALFMGVFAIKFKQLAKFDLSDVRSEDDAKHWLKWMQDDLNTFFIAVLGVGGMFIIYQLLTTPFADETIPSWMGNKIGAWIGVIFIFVQPIFQFIVIRVLAGLIAVWSKRVSWEIKSFTDVALIANLLVMHISYLSISWTTMPGWAQVDYIGWLFGLVQGVFTIVWWLKSMDQYGAEDFEETLKEMVKKGRGE